MRVAICCAWLVGCGFAPAPSTSGMPDAPVNGPIDASRPIDTTVIPKDAPPTWQTVETLTAPCSGTPVTSTTVLLTTRMYRVHATGECTTNTANGAHGDAEYFGYDDVSPIDGQAGVDNGISIDNPTAGTTKLPKWTAYASDHVYDAPWVGVGATITATYWDSNYGNNSGSLTVAILVFQ